ncbi:hypothetical protein M513_01395 [Trichuris suis]|uniref:Uncharacterized protein n=1 Tax=Trichuris suis TaxID=68888 RepID=A0A085MKH9_9BILA|nr:hypothetical protein M513_01395 [Trichuris suis]
MNMQTLKTSDVLTRMHSAAFNIKPMEETHNGQSRLYAFFFQSSLATANNGANKNLTCHLHAFTKATELNSRLEFIHLISGFANEQTTLLMKENDSLQIKPPLHVIIDLSALLENKIIMHIE